MTPKTFRAAYVPADQDSTGAGILLTGPEHAHLSEADLIAVACSEWHCIADGPIPTILIADWTE
jgi:hypothetical protein